MADLPNASSDSEVSSLTDQRVAVIGGGITGLTAAYALVKRAARVTVLEPGPPGGVIRSVRRDGFVLEGGPNVFLAKPEITQLLAEIGLSNETVLPTTERYQQFVWFNGRPTLVPKSPGQFFRTPFFPGWEKFQVLGKVFKSGVLTPHAEDESVATFLSRLVGERAVHSLIDPALKGIFGGSVRTLSARALFPQLWTAAKEKRSIFSYLKSKPPTSRSFVLRDGLDSLSMRLLASIRDRAEWITDAVQEVRRESGGAFTVATRGGRSLAFDKVVVAAPARAARAFLEGLDLRLAHALARVRYASLIMVHCAVLRSAPARFLPPRAFGVLFPYGVEKGLLGVMFNSNLFPHVAPADMHLMMVSLGGVESPEVLAMDDEQIRTHVVEILERRFGIQPSSVLGIHRWHDAIPQYELGHTAILQEVERVERENPGLIYLGTERGGIGVPDRVKTALSYVGNSL